MSIVIFKCQLQVTIWYRGRFSKLKVVLIFDQFPLQVSVFLNVSKFSLCWRLWTKIASKQFFIYFPPFSPPFLKFLSFFLISDNLGLLADRLIGPFDIEAVVDPIGVKISDAIMNFQNSGYEVTSKVFEDCGRPRLQKRQVNILLFAYKVLHNCLNFLYLGEKFVFLMK